MKKVFSKTWGKLKNPPTFWKIFTFILTLIGVVLSLYSLFVDYEGSFLEIIVYALYGVSAIMLTYSLYLLVIIIPNIKRRIIRQMEKYSFTYLMLRNYGFKTVIFSIVSFVMSIIFSLFNGYMGIMNRSIWYGALSAYYIALALLRGGILAYHKGKIGKRRDRFKDELDKAKVYRNSGIVLLILNVALSTAIAQMIFASAHFSYVGLTIFAYSAYAFYKITMSIVNLIKAHRESNLAILAIRNVNLTDATVSILALQTALLITFNQGKIDISLMNTITGIVVSAFSIGLGIYMIVSANKKIKEIQKEENKSE